MANRLKMAMVDAILRLLQRGWSYRRIGRELGIHRDTVARLAGKSKPAKAPLGAAADCDHPKPAKAPLGSEDGNGHSKPTKNSTAKERAGKEE